MTNRDFYLLVESFEDRFKSPPPLELYLRSLWWVVSQEQHMPLTAELVATWLEQAFTQEPPPFDPQWDECQPPETAESATFATWEALILFQIADLRRMAEAGMLKNEYRYFGITSPSGAIWYNFDPITYLECGVRGTIGGYAEDEVIVVIPPTAGETADSPIIPLSSFGWGLFIELLECGQWYE